MSQFDYRHIFIKHKKIDRIGLTITLKFFTMRLTPDPHSPCILHHFKGNPMSTQTKQTFLIGLIAGSVWAFSEVVLGALLRTAILPMRGTLLTGIGAGILFTGFGYSRQVRVVALAVLTAVIARIVFASSFGSGISVTNGSLAVLITGIMMISSVWILKRQPAPHNLTIGLIAAVAVLCSGTLFQIIGIRYDPCPYLLRFTALTFFLRETILWAALSGLAAPLGFQAGKVLSRYPNRITAKSLPAWGIILGCWICCGLTVLLTSSSNESCGY